MENENIEILKKELEWSGKRIIDRLYWVKSTTRQIDEQFKNNNVGDEMEIHFNSLGEFQGKGNEVDMEIARFTSLQQAITLLERKSMKHRNPAKEGMDAAKNE